MPLHTQSFEEIKRLVKQSAVSEKDRRMLISAFLNMPEEGLAALLSLVRDNPSWLVQFSENIQLKRMALVADDPSAWEKIAKEEIMQLEGLGE